MGSPAGVNLVAFSGGVDSSLVAYLVHRAFPGSSVACLGRSASLPDDQLRSAQEIARSIGIPLEQVFPGEGRHRDYVANTGMSCYHCKSHLYEALQLVASKAATLQDVTLFNGTNADDMLDATRVGLVAAKEYAVRSPLAGPDFVFYAIIVIIVIIVITLAGFTKEEVRAAARNAGLANWDHAASPCLRSRLQFGVEATEEHLARVEAGEQRVREILGTPVQENLRVRYLAGGKARIELEVATLQRVEAQSGTLSRELQDALLELGFKGVSTKAFRSGSLSGHVPAA